MTPSLATTKISFATTWGDTDWLGRVSLCSGIVGRMGVALLFIGSAHFHLTVGWDMTLAEMNDSGVPFPILSLWLGMAVSSVAAFAFLIGFQDIWAARGLAVYSLIVSYVIEHPFATAVPTSGNFLATDFAIIMGWIPPKNLVSFIAFMKDCAISGSLLTYASFAEASLRARKP